MKTIYTSIFLLTLCFNVSAQTIEKSSIDSGGSTVSNANLTVLFTLGEVHVNEILTPTIKVSQGFIGPLNGCLALSQSAENLEIIYDGQGNVDTVNTWLANNGNATVNSSCGEVNWSYNIIDDFLEDSDGDFVADRLYIEIEFIASATGGDQVSTTAFIIFDDFATAGESAGNGGAICDESFPISNFDDDISFPGNGVNYTDSKFASSTFEITQTFGKPGLQL
ncbi:MAG: hypothetical protein HKN40_14245, partial [Winogradskyella sp.]|nr:hypothetical protein [Winogradskyella sp.]